MPIVESRIDKIEPQRPGRIRVHEFFRDQTGLETTNIYDVPEGYDTVQHLADAVVFRDAHLLESEAELVEVRVREGEDPALITVDHITLVQRLLAIVTSMMRGRPHEIIRAVEWLDTNVSDAQLDTAVGAVRRVVVRERISGLLVSSGPRLALREALAADEALRDG